MVSVSPKSSDLQFLFLIALVCSLLSSSSPRNTFLTLLRQYISFRLTACSKLKVVHQTFRPRLFHCKTVSCLASSPGAYILLPPLPNNGWHLLLPGIPTPWRSSANFDKYISHWWACNLSVSVEHFHHVLLHFLDKFTHNRQVDPY